MRYSAVIKYPDVQYAGHAARMHFRESFLQTELCRRLEANRITYFTVFRFGQAQVIVKVNDDEFILIKMSAPKGLIFEKQKI